MQPLNIFVVHASDMLTDHLPNGAGWIVFNYLKGLTERGHIVHVAVPKVEMLGSIPRGMHLHVMTRGREGGAIDRLSYMLAVRRLFARLSAEVRFDIAQQFTPVNTGLSLAMLGSGVPLVLGPYSGHWPSQAFEQSPRGTFVSKVKRYLRDRLAAVQQRQAYALIITCPAAITRVVSSTLQKRRLHVISHAIHSNAYPERSSLPDKPSILFLANIEYRKGIFTLLDAFASVAQAIPDCTLEIWGDGREAEGMRQRVLKAPCADRIHLRGRASRDRVSEIMRSHSVYCMPSHGEPFGMTILEAMASGLPVVTTNAGGPAFLIHEQGGRVVPMQDSARLAGALIEILSDRELQKSMGRYNRNRVEQEFEWSRSLDRMESVYERVLSKRAASSGQDTTEPWNA
jgi:glycosyltransferase involved in cell wall biosynthesis